MEKSRKGFKGFLDSFKPRPVPVIAPRRRNPHKSLFDDPHFKTLPALDLDASGNILLAEGRVTEHPEEMIEAAKHYVF